MIKQFVTDLRLIPGLADDPDAQAAAGLLCARFMARWRDLQKNVRDRIVPVKHSLTIEPVAG